MSVMSCDDNHEARSKDRAEAAVAADRRPDDAERRAEVLASAEERDARRRPGRGQRVRGRTFDVGPDGKGNGVTRRGFVQVASLSTAIAAVGAACQKPRQKIVPVRAPPRRGGARQPAGTSRRRTGSTAYGSGLLVVSHEGRPTKGRGQTRPTRRRWARRRRFEQSLTSSVL
jgi:hypothetical protein